MKLSNSALFIIPLYVLLMLSACGGEKVGNDAKVFHYNQPNTVTSMDPAFARNMTNMWAVNHVFSKLLRTDEQGNIIGDVAKSWHVSEDKLVYTFTLKRNVHFHSVGPLERQNRLLRASDVQYSFERIVSPDISSPGSWIFKGRIDEHRPFEAPNDSTFILRLSRPFAPILSILTMEYCGIVCPEAVEFYGDNWRTNPVGTGPYMMDKWFENEGLFLRKNLQYESWNTSTLGPESIRVSFMRDRKTALIELLGGNIDFASGYDPTYRALLLDENGELQKRHSSRVKLIKSPFLNTEYLGVNLELAEQQKSPLADVNFRKALNFGSDREQLIQSLNGGIGTPAHNGFIPRGLRGFDDQFRTYVFNLDSAKYYLNLSSYSGETIELLTNKDYLEKCLFASRQWERIGVQVEVNLLESSILRDRMRNGEALFFRASWIGDYPDAENFLVVFKSDIGTPPNYTRYHSPDFDSLYDLAVSTASDEERIDYYQKANQLLSQQCPTINLYYDQSFWLMGPEWEVKHVPATNTLLLDQILPSVH